MSDRADEPASIYANHSRAAFTPFDVQITFGRIQGADLVTVCMSPQQAKALILVVESAVRRYEACNGDIRLTTAQQPKLLTAQRARKGASK